MHFKVNFHLFVYAVLFWNMLNLFAGGPLDFDDIVTRDKKYSSTNTYAQSKMCNIFFTKELARRLEGTCTMHDTQSTVNVNLFLFL